MKPFSELTSRQKTVEILRWICVPAAAVLGVIVFRLIAGSLITPMMAPPPGLTVTPPSDFRHVFLPRLLAFLMPAAFVLAGALTAPRRRLATAIALTVLWILYSFLSHIAVHLGRGTPHIADFLIEAVGAPLAAAYVFRLLKSGKIAP